MNTEGNHLVLYNTLSRTKEVFTPLNPDHIGLYVCGPTVYNRIHLGNARSVIVFDIIYRFLKEIFPNVTYVRNITDVDDKINKTACEKGISIQELTQKTTKEFHQDIKALNIKSPTIEPRATDHIPDIIVLIERIIKNGHAYEKDGHVLFDVPSFPGYGTLSRMALEQIIHGARVEVAHYKKNPQDFVLWKPSKNEEPGWESPWGYGRPGWHIECSAMSFRYLEKNFDIHGGGSDLIFPHHENECAQSSAALGCKEFARYWLHNGMLMVNGEKMSKSLGNFTFLYKILEKYPGEVVRWALLSTHYRQLLNWTDLLLQQASVCVEYLYQSLWPWEEEIKDISNTPLDEKIKEALYDDFNTPQALGRLQYLANKLNKALLPQEAKKKAAILKRSAQLMGFLNESCDNWFQSSSKITISEHQIEMLIEKRNQARNEKNYQLADKIRMQLQEHHIILEDLPGGKTLWKVTELN